MVIRQQKLDDAPVEGGAPVRVPPCIVLGVYEVEFCFISVRRSFAGACSVYTELGPADIPPLHRSISPAAN